MRNKNIFIGRVSKMEESNTISALEVKINKMEEEIADLKEKVQELKCTKKNTVVSQSIGDSFTATVAGSPSTDKALTNNAFYNPGFPFAGYIYATANENVSLKKCPVRIEYDPTVKVGHIGIGVYGRMYHALAMNQAYKFSVCKEPEVAQEVVVIIRPISGPEVSRKDVMENVAQWREGEFGLNGNIMAISKDISIKNSVGTYRVSPVKVLPNNVGIFTKDTVLHVLGTENVVNEY